MSRSLFALVGLLFSLVLFACSSTPPEPTVDSVSFPELALDAAGNYSAVGTIAAHSPNGAISTIQIHVLPAQNGVTLQDGAPIGVGGAPSPYTISLAFPPAAPSGVYTIQVTATDVTGATSAPYTTSVTVQ